jgi:hypothetical protein
MTLRPDLSSCSYTTRWQDRHKTEPSKQLFDLYFMSNTPTAQPSMLLGLSWSVLLLLDLEAHVHQLQIAAEEKNNANRPRTLAKLLFFLSLTASPTKKKQIDYLPSRALLHFYSQRLHSLPPSLLVLLLLLLPFYSLRMFKLRSYLSFV